MELKKYWGNTEMWNEKLYSECNVIISYKRWNKSAIFKSLLKDVSHSQQFSLQFNSKPKDDCVAQFQTYTLAEHFPQIYICYSTKVSNQNTSRTTLVNFGCMGTFNTIQLTAICQIRYMISMWFVFTKYLIEAKSESNYFLILN